MSTFDIKDTSVRLHPTADQTIPKNIPTKIAWDLRGFGTFDDGVNFQDLGTVEELFVAERGKWSVTVNVVWSNGLTGFRALRLFHTDKDGVHLVCTCTQKAVGDDAQVMSLVLKMAAGDTGFITVEHSNAQPLQISAIDTTLSAFKLA